MEKIVTNDGSVTFYNEKAKDHYHTKSGAREEAFDKHASALGIEKGSVIYDICFGLGYNSAAAIDLIGDCTIYCFENDKDILKKILEIDADFECFGLIKEFVKRFLEDGKLIFEKDNVKLIMCFGDAKLKIDEARENSDFVFFDPFSPAKVPDMWSSEFFKKVFDNMNAGGKLSTYSYARFVRDNMRKAGFEVIDGPVIGRRSPSTIGIRH